MIPSIPGRGRVVAAAWLAVTAGHVESHSVAQPSPSDPCDRPAVGALVPEPDELRSVDGVLKTDLVVYGYRAKDGTTRYCYRTPDGHQAPTLRVHPGDLVILRLSNRQQPIDGGHNHPRATSRTDPCTSGAMSSVSTNLHFHGLTIPPVCHQDEVLKVSIQPDDAPFEYRFRVPENEPPGLNWYHPHIHGFTSRQVGGGASGALIIEGLERAIPEVARLPERVFVIRDQDLVNPNAPASSAQPVVPKPALDPDGDVINNNTGFGKPARDLSINFVPVPYPDYIPAKIKIRPGERQLWRVLNASAITYAHLMLLYNKVPQDLGVVAIDGVPVSYGDPNAPRVKHIDHLVLPPGSRGELIIEGPAAGSTGLLVNRTVDTGPDGENDPNRALASVEASEGADEPRSRMPQAGVPLPPPPLPWVGSVTPVRTRKLYFSEARSNPADPMSPTVFFLTVDGEAPAAFDPSSALPNIVAHQGDVEDWIIENRSAELHAFHIHQIHFQLREWYGFKVNEPFLRDTVSVPYFDNRMTGYPSVRVRMDFRDPNTVGTFPYHCHLLEHEDGGMMGTIRVEPADP